jgi:SHS2 domain-containing protein
MRARYEHFAHGADIGARGFGGSGAQAFEQAALAMTAAVTDLETVAALQEVDVGCGAPDRELLLADWLNAIVYEIATRHMVFGRFQVHVEECSLHGKTRGEEISAAKHEPGVD